MGYNINLSSVTKVKGFLDSLKNTRESVLCWKSSNSKQLQYHIHCGLKAAEAIEVEEYMELAKMWKIRHLKDMVIATRRDRTITQMQAELVVDDVSDVYELITNIIRYKEIIVSQPLLFRDIILDDESKSKLHKYCDANDLICQINEGEIRVIRTS